MSWPSTRTSRHPAGRFIAGTSSGERADHARYRLPSMGPAIEAFQAGQTQPIAGPDSAGRSLPGCIYLCADDRPYRAEDRPRFPSGRRGRLPARRSEFWKRLGGSRERVGKHLGARHAGSVGRTVGRPLAVGACVQVGAGAATPLSGGRRFGGRDRSDAPDPLGRTLGRARPHKIVVTITNGFDGGVPMDAASTKREPAASAGSKGCAPSRSPVACWYASDAVGGSRRGESGRPLFRWSGRQGMQGHPRGRLSRRPLVSGAGDLGGAPSRSVGSAPDGLRR